MPGLVADVVLLFSGQPGAAVDGVVPLRHGTPVRKPAGVLAVGLGPAPGAGNQVHDSGTARVPVGEEAVSDAAGAGGRETGKQGRGVAAGGDHDNLGRHRTEPDSER
ncbi:hypothetical protein GCM10010112_62590 [Actinoplanes lobatus]|nr:hypothetical protein GCM10010112_62590 [Actinoplanes lobatus]